MCLTLSPNASRVLTTAQPVLRDTEGEMKVFVWQRIQHATSHYHPQGGVVVFAENVQRARELAAQNSTDEGKPECVITVDEAPDAVREVVGGEEAVYIMPDAGCC